MGKGTPAVRVLEQSDTAFELHAYEADGGDRTFGEAVAAALGVEPQRVFKTLIATIDGAPVVGIVPVSGNLSMRKLARAAGGKRAAMVDPAAAQRITGYVVGGISPLGQRRRLATYLDVAAIDHNTIFVSAGRRGLQAELAPDDLIALTDAVIVDIGD